MLPPLPPQGPTYRLLPTSDVSQAHALEELGFPADEAASLPTLQSRQLLAPHLFLGAYEGTELLGFICSTLTPSSTLTHDSMSTHVPGSSYVALHSVCISPLHRRKGIAKGLLRDYIARMERLGVRGVRLITHEGLRGLYESVGFAWRGESEVVHGGEKWFEMSVDFEEVEEVSVRNPGKQWRGLEGMKDEGGMNAGDLYCPRGECRCLLLKAGVGKWVERPRDDLPLPALSRPIGEEGREDVLSEGYWSIPSPLSFENIGFSRNALPPTSNAAPSSSLASTSTPTIKYLICADCDHGPLGWHDTEGRDLGAEVEDENEGRSGEVRRGREFLIDCARVRYKMQ